MLTYTKKIFDQRANNVFQQQREEKWDGESIDEEAQQVIDDKERKENIKLQQLIEKPLYVYKGMIFSDGILSKNLKVIPVKGLDDTINAKCQFKKCIFSVEIFDNCTYH